MRQRVTVDMEVLNVLINTLHHIVAIGDLIIGVLIFMYANGKDSTLAYPMAIKFTGAGFLLLGTLRYFATINRMRFKNEGQTDENNRTDHTGRKG